jgi:protein-S-isoprenylcysteine O-methyltransferase Ste14
MEAWITLRARKTTSRDKTVRTIWILNFLAILIGNILRPVSFAHIPLSSDMLAIFGTSIILAGLLFRIWSIRVLGKFFEPTVVIKQNQPIIKTGPYKHIRHPAYAGGWLSFIGCGIALGNWIGLILIMILVFIGFYYRIRQEEKILLDGFGEEYQTYIKTTKKLIPFIY